MMKHRILILDDERDMREFLEIMLRKEGYDVACFGRAADALDAYRAAHFDLVITDIRMPGVGGLEFLKSLKDIDPGALVIMITAYASVDTAIEAMKSGAYDYFTKPFNVDEIKLNIKKALRLKTLERENEILKKDLKKKFGFSNIIGASGRMKDVYDLIMSVARTRSNVVIAGESGTGKELVARAIHLESDRKDKSFVAINCGAIPENLLESELFGHQKGAFTGAVSNKEGLVEQADGGTLFLDEITEMPVTLQVKLLRFIQERTFRRVGGTIDLTVDIRIISASNRGMEDEVKSGRFREDLFYRLNVIRINLPPLRERKEDIPLLARFFVERYSKEHGKDIKGISEDAMGLLVDYDYTGNVRELENAIERAVAFEPTDVITPASLPEGMRPAHAAYGRPGVAEIVEARPAALPDGGIDLEKKVEEYERKMILDALKKTGGAKKKAAALLGLSFRSMRYKLSKYDIQET
ncbi:MAG: sigma-54 dependent transcriptional regulator [Deltaproteobacteria bacterium]